MFTNYSLVILLQKKKIEIQYTGIYSSYIKPISNLMMTLNNPIRTKLNTIE